MALRQQLTLFVAPEDSGPIEALRAQVDPVQSGLIRAHVTLCRESELALTREWRQRLVALRFAPLRLRFGAPRAFDGHGWLVPCVQGEEAFEALRLAVLGGAGLATQRAHLTLAHPRNPKAAGNSPAAIATFSEGLWLTFSTVTLIEQRDLTPWQLLETWHLSNE